jgi:hypothetical protein
MACSAYVGVQVPAQLPRCALGACADSPLGVQLNTCARTGVPARCDSSGSSSSWGSSSSGGVGSRQEAALAWLYTLLETAEHELCRRSEQPAECGLQRGSVLFASSTLQRVCRTALQICNVPLLVCKPV